MTSTENISCPDTDGSQKSDISEISSLDSSLVEKVSEGGCEKSKIKRIYKKRVVFSWEKYLEITGSSKCPVENFPHCDSGKMTPDWKEGMKLESVDPKHPWLFCMVTVMERRAFRLRINFDGYAPCYDFLCHISCPFLLPVNWCRKNRKSLDNGRGLNTTWDQLSAMSECFATEEVFPFVPDSKIECNKYVIEAVDHKNIIRVARIIQNIGSYVLAKFEDLPMSCSKWFSLSSPCLKPLGWCSQNNVSICEVSVDYLSTHNLSALPSCLFQNSGSSKFAIGQKLEAVDQWNPILVRICTIVDILSLGGKAARLKLSMDGWSEIYSFWVDADSDEIYYPGFCASMGYTLTVPCDFGPAQPSSCPTPECRGQGHVKGPRFLTHHNAAGCPYSSQCTRIPDRLTAGTSPVSCNKVNRLLSPDSKDVPPGKSEMTNGTSCSATVENSHTNETATNPVLCKKPKFCCGDISDVYQPQELLERAIYNSVFGQPAVGPYTDLSLCIHHRHKLLPTFEKPKTEVSRWTPEDVAKFVNSIPGCDGDVFIKEQIDGEAFQLLTQADIVRLLNVRMGPALKIYHGIQLLQNNNSVA